MRPEGSAHDHPTPRRRRSRARGLARPAARCRAHPCAVRRLDRGEPERRGARPRGRPRPRRQRLSRRRRRDDRVLEPAQRPPHAGGARGARPVGPALPRSRGAGGPAAARGGGQSRGGAARPVLRRPAAERRARRALPVPHGRRDLARPGRPLDRFQLLQQARPAGRGLRHHRAVLARRPFAGDRSHLGVPRSPDRRRHEDHRAAPGGREAAGAGGGAPAGSVRHPARRPARQGRAGHDRAAPPADRAGAARRPPPPRRRRRGATSAGRAG